jgi:hypothetical protein
MLAGDLAHRTLDPRSRLRSPANRGPNRSSDVPVKADEVIQVRLPEPSNVLHGK